MQYIESINGFEFELTEVLDFLCFSFRLNISVDVANFIEPFIETSIRLSQIYSKYIRCSQLCHRHRPMTCIPV